MSREREAALRSAHMNRTPDPVMDNADMEGTGLRWRNAPVNETTMNNAEVMDWRHTHPPVVNNAPEDALHTIWTSEHKRLVDGRWYVPISEVSKILTTPAESKGYQPRRFKRDGDYWFAKEDRKQRGR